MTAFLVGVGIGVVWLVAALGAAILFLRGACDR